MRYVWLRARRLFEVRQYDAVGERGAVSIGKLESWSDVVVLAGSASEAEPEHERNS